MATVKPVLNGKTLEAQTTQQGARTGLVFERFFTDGKNLPFDRVEWETRSGQIGTGEGVTIVREGAVEVPKGWSQLATKVVASRSFRGKRGALEGEGGVRAMMGRGAAALVRLGELG